MDGTARALALLHQLKPLQSLVTGHQKVGITDRLQQIVECIHAETIHGILVKGGGKHDTRLVTHHPTQLQTIEFGHLDVEKQQVYRSLADAMQGVGRIGILADQFQKRYLLHITRKQFHCQRFIVNNRALDNHDSFFLLMMMRE